MTSASFKKRIKALEQKLNPTAEGRVFVFGDYDWKIKVGNKKYSIEEIYEKYPKAKVVVIGLNQTIEWERERERRKARLRGEISSSDTNGFDPKID